MMLLRASQVGKIAVGIPPKKAKSKARAYQNLSKPRVEMIPTS